MGGRLGQSPFDALSRETFEYPIALIRSAPRSKRADEASQCPLWPIYAAGVVGQRVTTSGRKHQFADLPESAILRRDAQNATRC